ncbi:hypothetical protein F5X96DRAFT_664947 [Biscogniauxia mediterranea]|nr:hypothetical protein F5X96DRAFT_664947 [Biscogniauxia mediterranea]
MEEHQVPEDADLRIFITGGITAGLEHGFLIPEAGKDRKWIRDNLPAFRKKAGQRGKQEAIITICLT